MCIMSDMKVLSCPIVCCQTSHDLLMVSGGQHLKTTLFIGG